MNLVHVFSLVALLVNGVMELHAMHTKRFVQTIIVRCAKELKASARAANLVSFLAKITYASRWTLTAHILMDLLMLLLVAYQRNTKKIGFMLLMEMK